MYIFKKEGMKVPVKVWLEEGTLEQGAVDQIINVASLPFVAHHVALMPDAHQGYGCPIGSVVPLKSTVVPFLVGVDIGCGMCAVKTSLTTITQEQVKQVMGKIRELVPVGFNHQKEAQDKTLMPIPEYYAEFQTTPDPEHYPVVSEQYSSALKQLGTLGGGNHFIEIQKGSDGHIWFMIHSGSRNLGKKVADYYNKIAEELNEKWCSAVPKKWDLAFLPLDTEEAKSYIREMDYCLQFALANRKLMAERIKQAFLDVMPTLTENLANVTPTFLQEVNIHHNYAVMESHFGKNVMIHRKGATRVRLGEIGIIPGSQGTSSFIVEGLGNPDSFCSSSHGAGRKMGRAQACKTLDLAAEQKILNDKGIVHGIRTIQDLDEASGSYKDIDAVMGQQKDLVKTLVKLEPLGVVKG